MLSTKLLFTNLGFRNWVQFRHFVFKFPALKYICVGGNLEILLGSDSKIKFSNSRQIILIFINVIRERAKE